MMQRVLYIPHLYSYAACTQFLFALNNDFLLQASEPGCALSAPKLGHPVLHPTQLQEPSLLAQVFTTEVLFFTSLLTFSPLNNYRYTVLRVSNCTKHVL